MALLEQNDILFAHKALNIVPGLSSATRRVAGAIIDHFNKNTGQCDPSIERISKLLGIDRATVLRATERLCEPEIGLFEKVSHGGKSNRAKYLPCWEVFHGIVADWDARMKLGKAPEKVAELRRTRSQNCDVKGRRTATQTLLINQSKKPFEKQEQQKSPSIHELSAKQATTARLTKGVQKRHRAPCFLLPINGGRSPSHEEAAMAQAEKRWTKDILALGEAALAECLECMTELLTIAASRAEMHRRGDGLRIVLDAINQHRRTAHG